MNSEIKINIGKIGYFFVLLTLTISNQAEIKGNITNLFDSIVKNDSRKTETQRIILGGETVREQQAFDNMKPELHRARRSNLYINSSTGKVFRRDTKSINGAISNKPNADGCKSSRNAVKNILEDLGYDKTPKTISEWREAFGRLVEKYNLITAPNQCLQLRKAMEKNIDHMYGAEGKPPQKSYMEALEDALIGVGLKLTTNPRIMAFRETIRDRNKNGEEKSYEAIAAVYVEAAKGVYKELSIRAAHDLSGYIIPVPKPNDFDKINEILEDGGISVFPSYIFVISTALESVDLPVASLGGKDRRCLSISPLRTRDREQFKPTDEHGFMQEDVLHMFPEATGKPFTAVWVYENKKYHIQAEFQSDKAAQNGKYNNHGYLKHIKVGFDLTGCYVKSTHSEGVVIEEMLESSTKAIDKTTKKIDEKKTDGSKGPTRTPASV